MEDVARAAGVNRATVSRALKGPNRLINEQTRLRILSVAAQLGYRKDPLVSTLMAQRRDSRRRGDPGTLAIVAFWPEGAVAWETNNYFRPMREGLLQRAASVGFHCDTFICDGSAEQSRRLLRILKARGIEGVIIAHSAETFADLPLDPSGFACAYMGAGIREPHMSRAFQAHGFNMRLAVRKLRSLGYRRIGFATSSALSRKNDGAWRGAYLHLAFDSGHPPLLFEWTHPFPSWSEGDHAALLDWTIKNDVDAVLCHDEAVLDALARQRDDLGLFTLERTGDSPFSGIDDNRQHIGETVVDLVVAQLHRGERGVPKFPKIVQIEGKWVGKDEGLG